MTCYANEIRLVYRDDVFRPLLMTKVRILIGDPHKGILGSLEVTSRFLVITQDWKRAGEGGIV